MRKTNQLIDCQLFVNNFCRNFVEKMTHFGIFVLQLFDSEQRGNYFQFFDFFVHSHTLILRKNAQKLRRTQ